MGAAEHPDVRPPREKFVLLAKLALGSIAAALVFSVGAVLPLLYATTFELREQFRPSLWTPELLGSAVLLCGLYLFCGPTGRPLLQGAGLGVLAGLLVSLPKQITLSVAAATISDVSVWLPVILIVELWYAAVWGLAGVAVAWTAGRLSRRAAA